MFQSRYRRELSFSIQLYKITKEENNFQLRSDGTLIHNFREGIELGKGAPQLRSLQLEEEHNVLPPAGVSLTHAK